MGADTHSHDSLCWVPLTRSHMTVKLGQVAVHMLSSKRKEQAACSQHPAAEAE